jgi:purine-nucleoside phosphorylase
MILFGSCGLVKSSAALGIGNLVTPVECYAMESFTDMLLKYHTFKTFYPDQSILESFLKIDNKAQKINCATLGSLKLEEEYLCLFAEKNIQAVDMECSAFFSAAAQGHIRAMALFYITDIINEKPFYNKICHEDNLKLASAIISGAQSLCSFIK